jgi:hypothetical protein
MDRLPRRSAILLLASTCGSWFIGAAAASPITIVDADVSLYHASDNTDGFFVGNGIRWLTDVVPNGTSGTTATVTTVNTTTGLPVTLTLRFTPGIGGVDPNLFQRVMTDNPALHGLATFNYQNGTNTNSTTALGIPTGTQQAPFVNSITISGSSLTPTFTWTPPLTHK